LQPARGGREMPGPQTTAMFNLNATNAIAGSTNWTQSAWCRTSRSYRDARFRWNVSRKSSSLEIRRVPVPNSL
jgi:hypothetical protein